MAPKIIAIAGATGRIARLIITALLQKDPNVQIHAIARTPSKLSPDIQNNKNIKIFAASSDDVGALRKALQGASVCICCYNGSNALMLDGQKLLIDACIAEGVPRYIASDWALDFRALAFGDHPSKDPMKHVQAYLEEKEGQIKGVHILNGGFMEVIFAPFSGYVDVENDTFLQWGMGEEKVDVTSMPDVAKYTAEVALDESANGFLNFLGDRKSVKEIAKLYEQTYHVEPKIVTKGSLEELNITKEKAFRKEPENPWSWMGLFYQAVMLNGQAALGKLDNEKYPDVKPMSMEEFLKTKEKNVLANSMFLV